MGKVLESLKKRKSDLAAGRYPEIVLKQKDPVKWNVLYWRLLGIVAEGRETARLISASPTVREFGECVFAIFTPEGESVAFSRGILLHMASMGSSIQWMLENGYEEDPGFHPGDIFYNNDPTIGGAHSADQAVLLPVFYGGELVAWVGGLTHCMETGSTEPGGQAPSALSRYDDGQMVPCMKVGSNDRFDRCYQIMVERNTRDGRWWILDDRAKLAGCLKMRDALISLIDEYGVDYYKQAVVEMIEEGRRAAVAKIKQVLFPGRYRMPAFYDVPFGDQKLRLADDYLMHIPCEMIVGADGKLTFSYEGASSPGFHSNNASFPCTLGNHIYTLLQDVLYDTMFNNGLAYAFELNVPENSVLNPDIQYACSVWLAAISAIIGGVTPCLARAYYAMGYREEGFASKACTGAMFTGGIDQFGKQFAAFNFEYNSSGMGASSNMDGLFASNAMWNPESNLSDVEVFERIWPLIWLGRGIQVDGGGFGKYQGGASIASLYVVEHDVKYVESGCVASGDKVFTSPGLMGGYPAAARYRLCLKDTDYPDRVKNKLPLPHSEGDDPSNPEFAQLVKGTLVRSPAQSPSTLFKRYDIIYQSSGGGGGWGDPIERDPEKVKVAVDEGITSRRTAEKVYGVVFDGAGNVDKEKTAAKREQIRNERKARGIPVKEYMEAERKRILAGDVPPLPKKMYNDCFSRSERFRQEFIEFWQLPQDFMGF